MTHHASDIATMAAGATGVVLKTMAEAVPPELGWLNDLGVIGCMGLAIFFLLKDRASLLKELRTIRQAHEVEMEKSREKYESKLEEILAKAEAKAEKRCDTCSNYQEQ